MSILDLKRPKIIAAIFKRHNRRKLRNMLRGFRILRDSGRGGLVDVIKCDLNAAQIPNFDRDSSGLVFGSEKRHLHRSVQQYLAIRVAGRDFNRALLRAVGQQRGTKLLHPMPAYLRDIVESHGISVAHNRSAFLWAGYVIALFVYGVVGNFGRLIVPIFRSSTPQSLRAPKAAYFDRLAVGNIPTPGNKWQFDIVSWYAGWSGRPAQITALNHNCRTAKSFHIDGIDVRSVSSPLPLLRTPRQKFKFFAWASASATMAMLDMLRGRWVSAIMLFECGKRQLISLCDREDLAVDYLFNNSGWMYRPLWTYEAEKIGARILFYFYSTNCENFKRASGYPASIGTWDICSWPTYLVWNVEQKEFVKRFNSDANCQVVGPIWFSDTDQSVPEIKGPSIAVFDVQPIRDSLYKSMALEFEYYVPINAVTFVDDIRKICGEHGAAMVWKRKRDIGKKLHPKYRAVMNRADDDPSVVQIDPGIAAQRVIEVCDIVVSMPFTSTAIIARSMGKPSCYYDPLALLQTDDRAAHGIPILQSRVELAKWVDLHLKNSGERELVEGTIQTHGQKDT